MIVTLRNALDRSRRSENGEKRASRLRQTLHIGGDVLAVAIDDGAGRRAREPACRGLEGGGNLLVDHQTGFVLGAVLMSRKLREPKTNDLAGFDGEHGARQPRKGGIRSALHRLAVRRGKLLFSDHRGAHTF
jgi:hypothetical protein